MRKFNRTKRVGKKFGFLPVLVIALALISSAALIAFLAGTFLVDITGEITVPGTEEEAMAVTYDSVIIEETMMLSAMDYATINNGDSLSTTHTFDNTGLRDYQLTLTENLPSNSNPEDLWFGFDVDFLFHSDLSQVTGDPIYLDRGTNLEIDYTYDCHNDFENPLIPYPFSISWDLQEVFWYILTTSVVGSGTVTETPDLPRHLEGTTVDVEAFPDTYWEFDSWSDGHTGTTNPDTVTMNSDLNVIANFIETMMDSSVGFGMFDDGATVGRIVGATTTMRVYDSSDVLIDQVDYADGASAWSIIDDGSSTINWATGSGIDISTAGADSFAMKSKLKTSTDVAITSSEAIVELTVDSLVTAGVESGILFNIDDDTHYNVFCTDSATGVCYVLSIDAGSCTVPHVSSGVTCTSSDILRLQKNSDNTYDMWLNGSLVFTGITVI